jgi:hypothetical protein
LQTATSHKPPCRTWKKVVLLSVMRGEVGGAELATTWIRKMSEIDRLHGAVCSSVSLGGAFGEEEREKRT